ncbi:MAG: hypothetical protein ACI8RD_000030 [Bacillariaceae sp.]|jgi:hypothetical protein
MKTIDDQNSEQTPLVVDLVLGSDIAYYFHLIRPIMVVSRKFMGGLHIQKKQLLTVNLGPLLFSSLVKQTENHSGICFIILKTDATIN